MKHLLIGALLAPLGAGAQCLNVPVDLPNSRCTCEVEDGLGHLLLGGHVHSDKLYHQAMMARLDENGIRL